MKKFLLFVIFLSLWYYAFLTFLRLFVDSPFFIFDDPVLWFLFFLAFYHLEFVKKKY